MLLSVILPLVLLAVAGPGGSPLHRDLERLLATHPPDSLAAPLRAFERERGRGTETAQAAFLLGQLQYARGEYRQAAEAFTRAAARLDPARRGEARYWAGLSWLGVRDGEQARAVLEQVVSSDPARRADAQLALAFAWRMLDRPEQALAVLTDLLAHDPGEAAPAALECTIELETRLGHEAAANDARDRLLRRYPASFEAGAAAAIPPVVARAPAVGGATAVLIGSFTDPDRASALATAARRAGFPSAQVTVRGTGTARTHSVRLGLFRSPEEARRAGQRAADSLGVSFEIVRSP